ncbi:hypothetical protein PPTG_24656 [Phytophthora nicotianae INRA-310]|uniref:Uncharacterized protein n=1 Tax=Phytophthora nicotianae (strain INRA-310) TaxID=761204 RepID=W2PEA7_PHYN3|nr:hypothetical protein PPTG_24656 [Phytophthora nicotianae INRA-310]ETM98319.1 hypothetical protein PPTG_24656 [Phytophthora nicotianae INRA-310]
MKLSPNIIVVVAALEHPTYEDLLLSATTAETESILNYIWRSSLNLFSWMEWISKNNLPLSFCENEAA